MPTFFDHGSKADREMAKRTPIGKLPVALKPFKPVKQFRRLA
jgi:hypothetical protein